MSEEETAVAAPRETFGHPITTQLDGSELERKNDEHIKVCNEIEAIEQRYSKVKGEFNAELKLKRKEEIDLRAMINSKSMQVEVQCYQERDDRRGMMLTRRCDTGEIVDDRALTAEERGMTPDDRQGNLFEKKADGADAPPDVEEPEQRGDEDTENALSEYAAQQAAAGGEGESAPAGARAEADELEDEDDIDDPEPAPLGDDEDSEDAVAH